MIKGARMPGPISSVTEARAAGARILAVGAAAVVVILGGTAAFLFAALPGAGAFNARVEQLFIESEGFTDPVSIGLLEVLAQSGTAFSDVLASYRTVIFVLLLFATGLLLACLGLLAAMVSQNRRMDEIERSGIQVTSLDLVRAEKVVRLNDIELKLTDAAMETLAVLAEARLDGDVLTGAQIEATVSGKPEANCDEAAGATRIKRLRDSMGNQLVSALLVRNITRQGYVLDLDPKVIRIA